MHALDRFHLPRATAVSVVAAILAIVITLVLAAGVAGSAVPAAMVANWLGTRLP